MLTKDGSTTIKTAGLARVRLAQEANGKTKKQAVESQMK